MESSMSKLNLSVAVGPASQDEGAKTSIVGADREYNSQSLIDPDCEYQCEYREDIWKNLLQQEAEKPPIHLQSPQLEFRGTLVQQLREVTKKLGLGLATLHSAVAQLDLFMDAHRLRADRLTHVALACLSIAAKSEEKSSRAPTLKTLSKLSGVNLCGKTFRQLEWMVGQHIKWKLLAPTPVTFAALLVQFVVMDSDLTTRHPKFVRRFKRDGGKLLDAYLDLTLSDVRLKVVESVDVGCACVVCARTDLGLCAWPAALAVAAGRQYTTVAPIARRLQRMMQILKARESTDSEVDQGYGSARTSPNQTPSTSPRTQTQVSHGTSTCCSSTSYVTQCEDSNHRPTERPEYSVLDMDDTNFRPPPAPEQQVPVDMTCHRVYNPECSKFCIYCRSSRLLDASLETVQPTTSVAVKRGTDTNIDFENKRYRLISQAVL